MRRIYTRTGDMGTTAINGKIRVPKTDIRIEANGTLDELNVAIGIVRTFIPGDHEWQASLKDIQMNLMAVMSLVATRSDMRDANPNSLPASLVDDTEALIDSIAASCPVAENFILPGGSGPSAFLHQCRVTARRAERRLWALHETDPLPADILRYVNRLSDLFFIMARTSLLTSSLQEEPWRPFAYKRHPTGNP